VNQQQMSPVEQPPAPVLEPQPQNQPQETVGSEQQPGTGASEVQPTPQPLENAAAPMEVSEQPMCVFCQSDLGRDNVEAMLCGHAFHASCIDDYVSATGKSRRFCCPFKCSQSEEFAIAQAPVNQTVVTIVGDAAGSVLAELLIIDADGDRLAEEALNAAAGIQ
jgi:hypothetical protein